MLASKPQRNLGKPRLLAAAALSNSANIDLAVANAEKVSSDPDATDEDKANAEKGVRDASLAAFSGTTAAIAEEMRAIGPEGELMATVVESASLIANTMTAAFDVIGDSGASMGDKVQAGFSCCIRSYEFFLCNFKSCFRSKN